MPPLYHNRRCEIDAQYRAIISVEDNGSSEIDSYKQAVADLMRVQEEAGQSAADYAEVASLLPSELEASDAAVASLVSTMQDVIGAGGSVEDAIAAATSSFSDFYNEGYTAADMNQALAFALDDVSQAAGTAASELQNTSQAAQEASSATSDLSTGLETATDATDALGGGLSGVIGFLGSFGPEAAAAAAAIGLVTDAALEFVDAAAQDEVSVTRLNAIMQSSLGSSDLYARSIEHLIAQYRQWGISDDAVRASLATSIPITNDFGASVKIMGAAMELAAAKPGMSLQAATLQIARAYETGSSSLKRYGVVLEDGVKGQEVLDAVMAKFGGTMEQMANTAATSGARANIALSETGENLGKNLLGASEEGVTGLERVATGLEGVVGPGTAAGDAIGFIGQNIIGTALGPLERLNQDMALFGDTATEVSAETQAAMDGIYTSVADATSNIGDTWNDLFDKLTELSAEQVATMRTGGATSGEEYDAALVGALADGYPSVEGAINATMQLFNVSTELAKAGGDGAASFTSSMLQTLRNAKPGLAGEINSIIAMFRQLAAAQAGTKVGKPGAIDIGDVNPFAGGGKEAGPSYVDFGGGAPGFNGSGSSGGSSGRKGGSGGGKSGKGDAEAEAKKAEAAARKLQAAADAVARAMERANDEMQAVADSRALDAAAANTAREMGNLADLTDVFDAALDNLGDELDGATGKLESMRDQTEETLHSLDNEIRNANLALKDMEKDAEAALDPLITDAKRAHDAVDELSRAAATQREAFQDANDALNDQMRNTDAVFQGLLAPLQAQSQAISDELYNLANSEAAALASLNSQIEAQSAALDAEKRALAELSQGYEDDLIPLRKELADLNYQEHQDERGKQMQQEAQTVENLRAKLNNLAVGSREYNQTQKELAEAQRTLDRSKTSANLEDRIKAIEDEKQAAEQNAQASIRQHEEELRLITEQRDAVAKQFEDRRAQLEQEQAQIQRRMEMEQRAYEQSREQIQAKMDALAREEELYNRQERDKEAAAQEAARLADLAVTQEQEKQAARQEATRLWLETLETEREKVQHNSEEAERDQQKVIDKINAKIIATNDAKTAAVDAAKLVVDAYKTEEDALKAAIDLRKDNEAYNKAIADYADAYKVSFSDAEGVLGTLAPKVADMATGATNAGNAIKNDLTPAIQGLTANATPPLNDFLALWQTYLGTPTSGQMGTITNLLASHNPQGIWTYWEQQLALAMGAAGLSGKMSVAVDLFMTDTAGYFNAEHPTLDAATADFGTDLIDGITIGVQDIAANKALQDAVAQAVLDAIQAGKDAITAKSPSKKAYEELGLPIMQGGALGVSENAYLMADAVSAATAGSIQSGMGSVRIGVGAGAGSGSGGVNINLEGMNFSFPNIKDAAGIPTTKQGWKPYARQLVFAIADEYRAQGLKQ